MRNTTHCIKIRFFTQYIVYCITVPYRKNAKEILNMTRPTTRAMATALRTYHRPVQEGEPLLESWEQVVDRVIMHQKWLWERALGRDLREREEAELENLRTLIAGRYIAPAGRTL